MAKVSWANFAKGYNESSGAFQDYGFDLRNIILEETSDPFSSSTSQFYVMQTSAYHFVAGDYFSGSFVLGDSFSGIKSGTVNSFTRKYDGKVLGTISGLSLDYSAVAAAAKTPTKTDDMALWAKAFAGNDIFSGSKASDRFEGFAGNDTIKGMGGADKLYGGAGADTFIFSSTKDSTMASSGRDTI
ncbi:hypothetical protein [Microvirga sp. TS319]|uniref:hypothetical protein n=1 Tax=Microvirga sp. TS319 TaxID=3241165 RepID=UPI00351A4953